ncbi:MAG: cysteine peptidase family C39 domain-containing protein [Candidatus Tectomicrobia bacterium]
MLHIPHLPQTNPQDLNSCVPATIRMVLAFQSVPYEEEALCDVLETQPVGTAVLNVLLLNQHVPGCHVEVASASLNDLARWIAERIPPIVFVTTGPLSFWQIDCLHALVVVDIDDASVWVHDPAFENAPISIQRDEFLRAWGELAQLTALIRISPSRS